MKINKLLALCSIILSLIFAGLPAFAQTEKAKADAQNFNFMADESFKFGAKNNARDLYERAVRLDDQNVKSNYMTGLCYLQTTNRSKSLTYLLKAYDLQPGYVTDMAVGRDLYGDLVFLIAQAYHLNENFDKASDYYKLFKKALETNKVSIETRTQKAEALRVTDRKLYECTIGRDMVSQAGQSPWMIEAVPGINTDYPDYAPSLTTDENTMIFTSRRPRVGVDLTVDNDNFPFEDIYISKRNGGSWSEPVVIDEISTPKHESNVAIAGNGKTILLYKDDNAGDIYVSKLGKDGKWSKPKSISPNINTSDFKESSAFISNDGKYLYFSSDRAGGLGGMDIYVSENIGSDRWSTPSNLGPKINTEFDDENPALDAEGKSLYFSSKGHQGMGGFDVFHSVFDAKNGEWKEPTNMGYPISTSDNDGFFVLGKDSASAYFASVRDRGNAVGDLDIFYITPTNPALALVPNSPALEKNDTVAMLLKSNKDNLLPEDPNPDSTLVRNNPPANIEPDTPPQSVDPDNHTHVNTLYKRKKPSNKLISKADKPDKSRPPAGAIPPTGPKPIAAVLKPIILRILVIDKTTGRLISADVKLTDKVENQEVETQNSKTGEYISQFDPGSAQNYMVGVEKEGYIFRNISVSLPLAGARIKQVNARIELEPIRTNNRIVLRNIYFNFNKPGINPSSQRELDLLLKFMKNNSRVTIEIAGHADAKGQKKYNLTLSQRRAESVVEYLRARGIDGNRLRPKGYGENRPLASNDDEKEGREYNRRTEFEILGYRKF